MEAYIPGAKVDHLPYGVQWELARICAAGGLKAGNEKLADDLGKLATTSNVEGVPTLHSCPSLGIPVVANSNASAKEREIKVRGPAVFEMLECCIHDN